MFNVVGVRKCSGDFNGKPWSHTKLYVLSEDKNVKGFKAEYLKVPDDVEIPEMKLPCKVSISFDRYGSVADIVPCES